MARALRSLPQSIMNPSAPGLADLKVSDFCMDLLNSTGELEFAATRCVQCGEVVDPVILRNRQLRQDSTAVLFAERMRSTNPVMESQS